MELELLAIGAHQKRLPDSCAGLFHRNVNYRTGMAKGLRSKAHSAGGNEYHLIPKLSEDCNLINDCGNPFHINTSG